MTIGIDISVLQTPHRMRGIGYTVINFINHLPAEAKKHHRFVFFAFAYDEADNPLDLLLLDDVDYEVRTINPIKKTHLKLPGRLSLINSSINQLRVLRDIYFGDSRIKHVGDLDRFIQFDQNQPVPAKRKVPSYLIIYDLIPYVMESDYLWSYSTARLQGRSRKGALRFQFRRQRYAKKIRLITKNAAHLLAISEHTKQDFVKHLGVSPKKISVCLLGIPEGPVADSQNSMELTRYRYTSWGYLPEPANLAGKKFLLFVGGADPRRKLIELIAAFNNLRAQGHDVVLALSGDTMKGPRSIPVEPLQKYFEHSSYIDDIYFLGFASDEQKDWLYQHALAFVYPSVYEGFGLPVLEAMRYGTPVITYNNSSITEIAGNAALFVEDFQDIVDASKKFLADPDSRRHYSDAGKKQAAHFSWTTTATQILKSIGA